MCIFRFFPPLSIVKISLARLVWAPNAFTVYLGSPIKSHATLKLKSFQEIITILREGRMDHLICSSDFKYLLYLLERRKLI